MTFDECKDLMALVVALDNRNADEYTIILWQDILQGYSFDECRWALLEFSRTSVEYLRPAHLSTLINGKRREWGNMSPCRDAGHPDAWLGLEDEMTRAMQIAAAVRATGRPYAVQVMERTETRELT